MRAYHISGPNGLDALQEVDVAEPKPGPGEVLVEMRAWSLNYRDLVMPHGGYVRNHKVKTAPPLIPLSDGAGEVVAIGPGVTRLQVGDRVAANFFTDWVDGDLTDEQIGSALGGATDGVLAEKVCLNERAWVRIPGNHGFAEAATLPCAAVTAWQALMLGGLQPGQSVLLLGTGGVSIFGLQIAKLAGARVIITSSSDEKLQRARELGADDTVNYRSRPEWQDEIRALTSGAGVDHVLEVGGAGTLQRSLASVRVSGTVSLIGILTGRVEENPSVLPALFNRITIRGVYVGSRRMFEDLVRSIEVNDLQPVIDRKFGFDEVHAAYEYLQSGAHLGKVVIER